MQKENRKKMLLRYLLGLSSDKEDQQIYFSKASQKMQQALWNSDPESTLSDSEKTTMLREIRKQTGKPAPMLWLRPLLRVAAVFLLGLIITAIIFSDDIFYRRDVQMVQVMSPAGQRTQVELPDGTLVVLDGSGRLEYPEKFDDSKRNVHLLGRAFFDVVSRKDAPFTVSTSEISVEVLGTKFSVSSYAGDPVIKTVLLEGSVQVHAKEQNEKTTLNPNQQYVYNSISRKGRVEDTDAKTQTGWIYGRLVFDEENIYAVCKQLEYWYGIDIEVRNAPRNRDLFTFTINNNSLEEVLMLMQKVSPLDYTITENKVIITYN